MSSAAEKAFNKLSVTYSALRLSRLISLKAAANPAALNSLISKASASSSHPSTASKIVSTGILPIASAVSSKPSIKSLLL